MSSLLENTEGIRCCTSCFTSEFARGFIESNGIQGWCDFCECQCGHTIVPDLLEEFFLPLISLFEVPSGLEANCLSECDKGERNLSEQIEDFDFEVFSSHFSSSKKCQLLDRIRKIDPDKDCPSSGPWRPSGEHYWNHRDQYAWNSLAEYLKTQRRFIVRPEAIGCAEAPDKWLGESVADYAQFVTLDPIASVFYRARLGGTCEDKFNIGPWAKAEMGAPPSDKTTVGRANPKGISFLYLAAGEETALAEVRPEIGAYVTIRPVKIIQQVRLVDLEHKYDLEDPIGDVDLQKRLAAFSLLNSLGSELAKPVLRSDSELDYLPSQFLTEILRDAGYDGIKFASSQHLGGKNIVIFDSTKCEVGDPAKMIKVDKIRYKTTP